MSEDNSTDQFKKNACRGSKALLNFIESCACNLVDKECMLSELKICFDIPAEYRKKSEIDIDDLIAHKFDMTLTEYYNGLIAKSKREALDAERRAYIDNPKNMGKCWFKYVVSEKKSKSDIFDAPMSEQIATVLNSCSEEDIAEASKKLSMRI